MAISAELFKDVFRRWPSGVAVATTRIGAHSHGMVVGSFCSLSSDPPLVMVSAAVVTRTHAAIDESGFFAVSILGEQHGEIFERFAGFDRTHEDDRFSGFSTIEASTGAPIFPEAVAWVDCRVVARHHGETYTIFVGEVVAASLGEAAEDAPIVYLRRQRRQLLSHT
jgi:flavin reductase